VCFPFYSDKNSMKLSWRIKKALHQQRVAVFFDRWYIKNWNEKNVDSCFLDFSAYTGQEWEANSQYFLFIANSQDIWFTPEKSMIFYED